jgi:methanogenic corrinoid protein MtbC1
MAAVFRELEIAWDGKTYKIKPTMRLLNEVEQSVSLSMLAYRLSKGEPPITLIATVFGVFLRSVGVNVNDEDIYSELLNGDKASLAEVAQFIIMAAYPQTGKPEAPQTT